MCESAVAPGQGPTDRPLHLPMQSSAQPLSCHRGGGVDGADKSIALKAGPPPQHRRDVHARSDGVLDDRQGRLDLVGGVGHGSTEVLKIVGETQSRRAATAYASARQLSLRTRMCYTTATQHDLNGNEPAFALVCASSPATLCDTVKHCSKLLSSWPDQGSSRSSLPW